MTRMEIAIWAAGIVIIIAVVIGSMYGIRKFSEAVTPLTVHEVEPGVKCASMITADGVALDCWKVGE